VLTRNAQSLFDHLRQEGYAFVGVDLFTSNMSNKYYLLTYLELRQNYSADFYKIPGGKVAHWPLLLLLLLRSYSEHTHKTKKTQKYGEKD